LETIDREISLKRLEKIQQKLFNHQINKNKLLEKKVIDVLVENKTNESSEFFGRSEHMTPVIFDGNNDEVGKIVKVQIIKSNQNTLFGKVIRKSKLRVA